MRTCLFCTSVADSAEDVWPCWITGQFRGDTPMVVHAERGGVLLPPWRKYQPELKVKWVCTGCNSGWMSRLEGHVEPYLQPMLVGDHQHLDLAGQTILSVWALKTAMALDGLEKPEFRSFSQGQREQLRGLSAIPWRTSVWLAAAVDASHFMSTKQRHLNPENGHDVSGATITMVFAHVVLQIFTLKVPRMADPLTRVTASVQRGPWDQATTQVWPASISSISWPPAVRLNGEAELNSLAERFATSAIEEDELDTIAV